MFVMHLVPVTRVDTFVSKTMILLAMVLALGGAGCSFNVSGPESLASSKNSQFDCTNIDDHRKQLCKPLAQAAQQAQDAHVREAFEAAFDSCEWAFEMVGNVCDGDDSGNSDSGNSDSDACWAILGSQGDCLALLEEALNTDDESAQGELLYEFLGCFEDIAAALEKCQGDHQGEHGRLCEFDDVIEHVCDELLDGAERANKSADRSLLIAAYKQCVAEVDQATAACQDAMACSAILDHVHVCDLLTDVAKEVSDDLAERLLGKVGDCPKRVIDAYEDCGGHNY